MGLSRRIALYHLPLFATNETNHTMTTAFETPLSRPFTLNEINVGTKLCAVLALRAANHPGESVFYGDLVDEARTMFSEDDEMKRAVPIGIGVKFLSVEAFCKENGYPNLASLAFNKIRKEPGGGFLGNWLLAS